MGLAITLTIAGEDRTTLLQTGSLEITDELKTRNRCSFELFDPTGEFHPEAGTSVVFQQDGEVIFAGTLDPDEYIPEGLEHGHFIKVSAEDYNQLCDRYHVTKVFKGQTIPEIIRAIFQPDTIETAVSRIYLENIDVTTYIQDPGGEPVEKLVCNWISVADVLNALAKMTSYEWYIDYERKLHFFDRETYAAPFKLVNGMEDEDEEDTLNFHNFQVRRTRADYRNWQIVRGSTATTSSQTDPSPDGYIGDGATRTFPLTYPVAELSSIEVKRGAGNWTAVTCVVQGTPVVGDAEIWSYSKGSSSVSQESGAVLTSADRVRITYIGQYPIIAQARLDDEGGEIDKRIAIEGGGGIYEYVEYDDSIEAQEVALTVADRLLQVYGKIPREIRFETDVPGLRAGQRIRIRIARFQLDDDFLIKSVTAHDVEGAFLRYSVQGVGSETDTWIDWFRGVINASRRRVAYENEKLLDLRTMQERVGIRDELIVTPESRVWRIGPHAKIGYAQINSKAEFFIWPCQVAVTSRR